MLLARTEAVSLRYSKSDNQCYGDAAILSDSNRRLRKLLLDKAYLMPGNLVGPSQDLVAHCDIWLRRFDCDWKNNNAKMAATNLILTVSLMWGSHGKQRALVNVAISPRGS